MCSSYQVDIRVQLPVPALGNHESVVGARRGGAVVAGDGRVEGDGEVGGRAGGVGRAAEAALPAEAVPERCHVQYTGLHMTEITMSQSSNALIKVSLPRSLVSKEERKTHLVNFV